MKERTLIKPRLLALSVAIACAAFAIILIVGLLQTKEITAEGPTYVSGGIFEDTTWSASQSLENVTSNTTLTETHAFLFPLIYGPRDPERDALLALYYSTNGQDWPSDGWGKYWDNSDGWGSNSSICTWYGVSCDSAGHVTELALQDNFLRGPLPPQIGDLAYLQVLNFSSSWERFEPYNQITDIAPELGNLGNLRELILNGNDLQSVPAELGNLSSLEILNLRGNYLASIPPELGNLANLRHLELQGNNHLTSIPSELGYLGNLQYLNLSHTEITSIPPELGNLSNLREFTMEWGILASIPPELGNLSSLRHLKLRRNAISSQIPPELGNLSELDTLDLSTNDITGPIPPELGNLLSLDILKLSNNNLSGSIPPEIGNLSGLDRLYLGGNYLSGPIPPELGSLIYVETVSLHGNNLSGSIPAALSNMQRVRTLSLGHEDSLCWETQVALDWALSRYNYHGPNIVCSNSFLN